MKLIELNRYKRRSRGKYFAKVDNADYAWLNQYNWSSLVCGGDVYARATINGKHVKMHRLILGLTDPKILGEHKDRDTLNNQRENLRPATNSQNQKNKKPYGTSKYLGVNFHFKKWRAAININGKTTHIGMFVVEEDAARAYDEQALIHHKEFANLNFK